MQVVPGGQHVVDPGRQQVIVPGGQHVVKPGEQLFCWVTIKVTVLVTLATRPVESATENVTVVPAVTAVGVPVTAPVVTLIPSPAGNEPDKIYV